jgi:regulator of sirC expression with transglutaminase-like and TPR domain
MQTASREEATPPLAQGQRDALISLLADEDLAIYQAIRERLLSYGPVVVQWLRPYQLSDDPVLRRRAREVVRHLGRHASDARLIAFCRQHGEELDLEQGTFLLAQTEYPEANIDAYQALFDQWAAELRQRLDQSAPGEKLLEVVNHYFFAELGFGGSEEFPYDPQCSYINRVVDRRTGNPVNLCAIYLFLAKRLRLPVTGIALANHFLCRYQSSTQEVYIDVFRRGSFMTKAECVRHLLRNQHSVRTGALKPVSARRIFLRMCANLHRTYAHLELTEDAARVHRYLLTLTRQPAKAAS